jgi:hypothetical protein
MFNKRIGVSLVALVLSYKSGAFLWQTQPDTQFYTLHCYQDTAKKVEVKLKPIAGYTGMLKHDATFIGTSTWFCSMTPGYDTTNRLGEGGHSNTITVGG